MYIDNTINPNGFADLSFGLVGTNNRSSLVNSDYKYIASADMQGSTVSQVPLPTAAWMMLSGILLLMRRSSQVA